VSVPDGYKATEVGVIPVDWEVRTLREVCRQIVDGTHFTPTYTREGVPFYSVENVTANDFKHVKFISIKDHELQNKRCNPERGDILMTRIGSLGDTRFIDWDVKASIYVSLALLKVGEGIDPCFLYAYSRSHDFRQSVENRSLMSAVPKKINMGAIGDVPVPVPPTDAEQAAVAEVLSDVDEAIAAVDAVIAKKRVLKTATMQALLSGTRRLPGFSGEWEAVNLGAIAHIKTGSRNNEDKQPDGKYPLFVRSQHVERINTYSYDEEAILVPGEGGVGSIFHYINGKFDCHQRVYKISQFANNMHGHFVYFSMVHGFGSHAMQNTVKATVDSLRLPTFKAFRFIAPSKKEQDAIAQLILDLDNELADQVANLAKLRRLKAGMMQQLLTGKIRLV